MAMIAYRNAADSAVVTISTGTAVPGFPAANMQRRPSGDFARVASAGVGGVAIDVDFGSAGAFLPRLIGIFGTNRSRTAGTSIWSGDTLGAMTSMPGITEEATALPGLLPVDAKIVIPASAAARRYWRIVIQTHRIPGGASGTLQIGRLWMSGADDLVEFPKGVDVRWSTSVIDDSVIDRTDSGIVFEDIRARRRHIRCTLTGEPTTRAFGIEHNDTVIPAGASLQQAQIYAGRTGEVVVLPRLGPAWRHLIGFRGHLVNGLSIEHNAGPLYNAAFEATEEL